MNEQTGQYDTCQVCGYKLKLGESTILHTLQEHPNEFFVDVIIDLPNKTQGVIFKRLDKLWR